MSLNVVSSFNGVTDPDAGAYIAAVEAADGQLLEFAVGKAINDFVVGCKVDGIWDAIKASCILAGARTFAGALIPLKGSAPTKFGTEGNWNYNRKDGLQGDGSTNYLDSNRNNNADPQNSKHISIYADTYSLSVSQVLIGTTPVSGTGVSVIASGGSNPTLGVFRLNGSAAANASPLANGLIGVSRSSSTTATARTNGANTPLTIASETPRNTNILVFNLSTSRLAFYSIGESLDLARLDSRVTDLINTFGAAIP